jgi:uncharacterized membrane protein
MLKKIFDSDSVTLIQLLNIVDNVSIILIQYNYRQLKRNVNLTIKINCKCIFWWIKYCTTHNV